MQAIDTLIYATHSRSSDVSINLDNQRVVILGRNGRESIRKYTVYRVRFKGDRILGNLRRKDNPNNPNPEYEFNPHHVRWEQTEQSKARDAQPTRKGDPCS